MFGYSSFENCPVKINPYKAKVKPEQFAFIVERAAKFVPGALCLAQAIAAQRGLARLGYQTVMRIGVKSDGHKNLLAHAWLLYQDRVILGGTAAELKEYEMMTDMKSAVGG